MNYLTLKGTLIIFISLIGKLGLCNVGADSICASNFADQLFDEEEYELALTEYRRLDFFQPTDYFKHQIGVCHQKLGNLQEAARIFKEIGAKNELIQVYIELEEYALARFVAQDLDKELVGWIYLLEGKWELAEQNFDQLDLKLSALNGEKLPYKSERVASLLSMAIPGAGEFYAGKWGKGIITFALNAISATLTIKLFNDKDYLGASLTTIFLCSRFYQSGIENAFTATREHNKKLQENYIKSITKKYHCPFEPTN